MMVKIWDVVKEQYWQDDDGNAITFKDEVNAKNMMYVEGYKKEYMETAVEFHPYTPIDKTGYDLQ